MGTAESSLLAGWMGILAGVVSGALAGLFFHQEEWLGGYGSFRRRLVRLGHVSFFGLGFLNLLFGVSVKVAPLPPANLRIASLGFLLGAATMPLCCFLTAWRPRCRLLFPVPVLSILAGVLAVLAGWP